MSLFEPGEPDRKVRLPHVPAGFPESLQLSPNLLVLGTRNTADRSIARIDLAIRRRFAFVDVWPSLDVVRAEEDQLAVELFDRVLRRSPSLPTTTPCVSSPGTRTSWIPGPISRSRTDRRGCAADWSRNCSHFFATTSPSGCLVRRHWRSLASRTRSRPASRRAEHGSRPNGARSRPHRSDAGPGRPSAPADDRRRRADPDRGRHRPSSRATVGLIRSWPRTDPRCSGLARPRRSTAAAACTCCSAPQDESARFHS